MSFVTYPGTILQQSLDTAKINANYWQGLRQSNIVFDDDTLYHHEPIVCFESYARLQLVPATFCNIVFIAFYGNPLGGHLKATRTFHQICLWFYLPNMYWYTSRMSNSCPGCALTKQTCSKSCKLVYNFPIEAPFMVLHINGYKAGKESGIERLLHYLIPCYLIPCCRMCIFAVMEPVTNANNTTYTYASAIMKIILCFGFCHRYVLDKDSMFWGCVRKLSTSSNHLPRPQRR